MFKKLGFTVALLFFVTLFASHAMANPRLSNSGFDVRAGLGVPILLVDEVLIDKTAKFTGITLTLAAGYRWPNFGIYLEQDIGGVWLVGDLAKDIPSEHKDRFLGSTYLAFNYFAHILPELELIFGTGVGVMYGAGDGKNYNRIFASNKIDGGDAAFAFKFKLGIGYYFSAFMGAGFNLDYHMAINWGFSDYDDDWGMSTTSFQLVHNIVPSLQVYFFF